MPFSISLVSKGVNTAAGWGHPPVVITTNSLPGATVGVAYSVTLTATGGLPPYIWSISAGALPTGLNMDVNGNITGAPSASGTFNFTVLVVDGPGTSDTLDIEMKH